MAAKKVTVVSKLEKRIKVLKLSLGKEDVSKDVVQERGLRKKLKRVQRRSKRLIVRAASIEAKARKKGSEAVAEKKEGE
ncbi:MAG: hypothetical protein ABGX83_05710 [Nitrospira sp.]|nr:hypothetical protein [Candidatus Manganitrophaceae bacterium]HIL34779.1 hypothetical protein [Candidatus Manganitrophaceae bacterium]